MATRTSTRHAAQKAKEAMAASPDIKRRGSVSAKRKGSTDRGPQPKREKKEVVDEKEPVQETQVETAEKQVTKTEVEPTEEPEVKPEEVPEFKAAAPALDGIAAGTGTSKEREDVAPSNILENGIIYFFYRPRVNVQEPTSFQDVARSFVVLRPTPLGAALDHDQGPLDTGAKCRLLMVPKKRFPTSGREREMGFVAKAGKSMKELQESFIAGETYETATRGTREIPEARPYAEGVYAITSTKRATHIVYVLTLPEKLGDVQEDFGLAERGSWLIQSKSPKFPGPPFARLPKDPEYPEGMLEKFRDLRWIPMEPELIDYPNAQFLMIGSTSGGLAKVALAEPGETRPEEEEPQEEVIKMEEENEDRIETLGGDHAIYEDLGIHAQKYPKLTTTWDASSHCSRTTMKWSLLLPALPLTTVAAGIASSSCPSNENSKVVNQTTCAGTTYAYTGLEGYGYVASNARDKYGDTLAGLGSSAALEKGSWRKTGPNSYSGIFYCLPDRGWNTNGTLNFQPRVHKFQITLQLATHATAKNPSKPNVHLKYLDTTLLTGPDGQPLTGLDPDATGYASYKGFPPLPAATYTGNGFGGPGRGGKRVSLDTEGLVIDHQGYFWISDEYGPYVYKFNKAGKMVLALQPPEAYLPRRNGTLSFSAASPPLYAPDQLPSPEDPETGRNNNQGFEGLALSPDGTTLSVMIQSALNQEGGPKKKNRQPARILQYDIASGSTPRYTHEYAVTLPKYRDYRQTDASASNAYIVASQSEILHLPTGDFLVLARDSGFGHGQDHSLSVYRHADVFAITSNTTDLRGAQYDAAAGSSIASKKGKLDAAIVPAEYCAFLDFNVESQLARFGLHNGGAQDSALLNEKWESFVLVPVDPSKGDTHPHPNKGTKEKTEYFLFTFSDNDFVTQNGYMNFGRLPYADESGYELDSQVLVFRVEF
ncbi:hypothetical protein ARAM_004014 [Aspergillus rambellii]|uniref:Phytase-like domain-containing protein n=1 Tax=Aspergillus rambellii TaxID=308745 RepID=A0A0F8UAX1_9EURO|nr:hypothetical protein ARAM_004014 [Aspergillus rambellii]